MIEFEKQTWYNKGDTANAAKRIPISASQLNRMEDAILSVCNHINDMTNRMTNHWWRRRKIVGGALEFPYSDTSLHIYPWDTITQESTVYYSSSVNVKIDNSTGKLYVELDDPNTVNISYYNIKYDNVDEYILRDQFIILSDDGMNFLTNTKDGGTTYSIHGYINENASGERYGINFPYTYKPQITPIYGDDEYVNSPDRDAYSEGWNDAGLLMYEYLGIPFENSINSRGILTGWYYGRGEALSLIQTSKKPKCVMVYRNSGEMSYAPNYTPYLYAMAIETYSVGNISITDNGFNVGTSSSSSSPPSINDKAKQYGYIVFY